PRPGYDARTDLAMTPRTHRGPGTLRVPVISGVLVSVLMAAGLASRSSHVHGRGADADVVVHRDPPVPHVGVHRAGHVAHHAAVVLGPHHVFQALGVVAEHPARGLVVLHHAHGHLVHRIGLGVLELVVPADLAVGALGPAVVEVLPELVR